MKLVLIFILSLILGVTNNVSAYTVQTDTSIKTHVVRRNACRYRVYCFSKYPLEKITVGKKKINISNLKIKQSGKYMNYKYFDVIKGKGNSVKVKIKNVDGKSSTKKLKITFK